MSAITESVVEDAALAWLEGCGWDIALGPAIAADAAGACAPLLACRPDSAAQTMTLVRIAG